MVPATCFFGTSNPRRVAAALAPVFFPFWSVAFGPRTRCTCLFVCWSPQGFFGSLCRKPDPCSNPCTIDLVFGLFPIPHASPPPPFLLCRFPSLPRPSPCPVPHNHPTCRLLPPFYPPPRSLPRFPSMKLSRVSPNRFLFFFWLRYRPPRPTVTRTLPLVCFLAP